MSTEVKVPNIGDFKEVEVIEVMVKVGDKVAEGSLLLVVDEAAGSEPVVLAQSAGTHRTHRH